MSRTLPKKDSESLLATLAEFRFELRRFLRFSEDAALKEGLHPQQHQLLLQITGAPEGTIVTIAYVADRLGLRHNSAVELVDRSECEGLLVRIEDKCDKRRAILRATRKGITVLARLSGVHAQELNEQGPQLIHALKKIAQHTNHRARSVAR
jgi:DNA-binding MarR family transcriptional regulator